MSLATTSAQVTGGAGTDTLSGVENLAGSIYADGRQIGPVVEQLAGENAGSAKVVKLNVDDAPNSAQSYGVSSIPTLMVFKDGEVVDRFVGVQPKARLQQAIDAAKVSV